MPGPVPHQRSDDALERACRDVEVTVARVAKLVLHASALADRTDAVPALDARTAAQRGQRTRVLRDAAAAGRRTISRLGLAAVSGT